MNKKIRFYLYILGILWLGAAAQAVALSGSGQSESIEAILMEEEYEGQLSKEELEALTSEIFAEKKAESVQGITGNGIFSAYGYSPLLPQNVISEGKRINLNVVSSYNEETDTTKIIVASPIYNEDY
ncbi:YwmB family TATA-box binding protein [Acetivibrio ethanolgignens]|uniref:Uncharacterized protein n=1 Tax=Acetivibrio ethanolgignens TaxID=290052 RepID=A0A0V8QE87_9FIRM|nr:YwmB family TATA-box binding protein [Acetivibrio ethanolgignens]KSV58901.1 hypothetical protein ASU35_11150 [Acetivibrio ethanolgignens]